MSRREGCCWPQEYTSRLRRWSHSPVGTSRLSSSNQLRTIINCVGRFRFAVINHHEVFTVSDSRNLPERPRSVT